MVGAKKLPEATKLREHVSEGLSNKKIAVLYGVSDEAVRQALHRHGIERPRRGTDHTRHIPWRVRADHTSDVIAKRLRSLSRRLQGVQLGEVEERQLEDFIRFMEGANKAGIPLSVHYDRTDADGFWFEPRRSGDRDYISPPARTRSW